MTAVPINPKLRRWLLTDPEDGGATCGAYIGFWCASFGRSRYPAGSMEALSLAVAVESVVRGVRGEA